MTTKLYIASKPAVSDHLNPQHLYLIYDPDGNPNSGDELIIRGGPPGGTTGFNGFINIEIAQSILDSEDGPIPEAEPPYTINDLPSVESRNFTLIEEGAAADALWATMVDFAISLSNDENAQAGDVYSTNYTYAPTNSNSNSTVATVLASAGLSVDDYLPVIGGDLDGDGIRDGGSETERVTFANVPGAHVFLSGGESNTFAGGSVNRANVFFDSADPDGDSGNDVFYGGALGTKVAKNLDDGKDAYFYIQPGPSERLTFSAIRDGSNAHIGNKVETPDGKYDELYSIEVIGNRTYDNTHAIMYQFNAGLQIRDLSTTELASLNGEFDNEFEFETAFEVDFGNGITTQFANFGDIITSEYDDTLALSAAIGRSFDGGGGTDVVDYSNLTGMTLAVEKLADGHLAVVKTDTQTQTQWTDHLYSIERVVGTDGADIFNGVAGTIGSATTEYDGGKGVDAYVFNVATDTGEIKIVDSGGHADGVDRLVFQNVSNVVIGYVPGTSTSHAKITFAPEPAEPYDPIVPFLAVEFDMTTSGTIETIEMNGFVIHRNAFQNWLSTGAWSTGTTPGSDVYDPTYNSGSGGGGMLPGHDSGGAIASMQVRPDVGSRYLNYAYAEEYLHPFIITSYSGGAGGSTMTFDTYLQSIQMIEGISAEDVRFTVNSSLGNAALTIHIDSVGSSYTINHFEAGKTLTGIALYDSNVHSWVQGVGAALQGSGQGNFTGTYTEEYTLTTGFVQRTYYLEAMHFAGSASIDLQQTMTFTGTGSADVLYGLDTRGDILLGLAGNDDLRGYGGNDTLIGGTGADQLTGGLGNDAYFFEAGFSSGSGGYDTIYENVGEGTDKIVFGSDINADDVRMWTDYYGYLYIQSVNDPNDIIRVLGTFGASGTDVNQRIEQIEFADSTVWDLTQGLILNDSDDAHTIYGSAQGDTINGNGGNDAIYGWNGNDTINGGAGADQLSGGLGDDIFVFEKGFANWNGSSGYDFVTEYLNEGFDTLHFGDGFTPDDLRMWTDYNGYLHIQSVLDPQDYVYVLGGFTSTGVTVNQRIEQITFSDETVWDLTQGLILHDTDDAHSGIYGSAQNDIIYGHGGNDDIRGWDGDDIIAGGMGSDMLSGGLGADTFVFFAEDVGTGSDTLWDFSLAEGDKIDLRDVLDAGYDPVTDALADFVQFTNSGSHSILSVDLDGAGTTYGWTQIATVYNHTNLDPDAMVTAGQLLAA